MLFLLILIILVIIVSFYLNVKKEKKKPIIQSKKTFKYTVHELSNKTAGKRPELVTNSLEFEPADIKYYQIQKLKEYKIQPSYYITDNEYAINDEYWHNIEVELEQNIIELERNNIQNPEHLVNEIIIPGVDTQNVHDTSVNKYIRNIFRDTPIVPHSNIETDKIIDEILEYANTNANKDTISKVLNTIKTRNSTISNLNDQKELDILTTIWNKANSKETDEKKNNIKDMLMIQIADTMSSKGHVLCPTGFADRISTSLIVEEPEKFPKTQSMINDEMMQTMANIRTQLEKSDQYTKLNDEEQLSQLKEKFFEKAEQDYEGILTKKEIVKTVEPWIDMI